MVRSKALLALTATAALVGAFLHSGSLAVAQAPASCPTERLRQIGEGDNPYHVCASTLKDARGMNPRECADKVMTELKNTYGVHDTKDIRPFMKFCMPMDGTLPAVTPIISADGQLPPKAGVANENLQSMQSELFQPQGTESSDLASRLSALEGEVSAQTKVISSQTGVLSDLVTFMRDFSLFKLSLLVALAGAVIALVALLIFIIRSIANDVKNLDANLAKGTGGYVLISAPSNRKEEDLVAGIVSVLKEKNADITNLRAQLAEQAPAPLIQPQETFIDDLAGADEAKSAGETPQPWAPAPTIGGAEEKE